MAGKMRKGTILWYSCAAVCMLVILLLAAGCSMNTSQNSQNGGGSGGSGGGSGGGISQSAGDTGTETWQATVSVTENNNDVYDKSSLSDPASTWKHELTSTMEFHGTFPVVVTHEKTSKGVDKYYSQMSPDNGYPVSGTYERHLQEYMTNKEALVHPMTFSTNTEEEQGSISKAKEFDFSIEGTDGFVEVDADFPTTGTSKETFSDPKVPPYEAPVTDNRDSGNRCGTSGDFADFDGGSHDLTRDGARYIFQCHVTHAHPYPDSGDDHYEPNSANTYDTTLKVTLDPEYVQGPTPSTTTVEPTVSLAPLEPTVSLAPLEPTVSLEPLVSPQVPLAPLVTNNP